MAHSVEGRFPFLDYRMVAFSNRLPSSLKLRGLTEKYLLKKLASRWLPESIWQRNKRPYRAPIHRAFFTDPKLDYVEDLLSEGALERSGLFQSKPVQALRMKAANGKALGETDDMALVGIISSQLAWHQFVDSPRRNPPIQDADDVKLCRQ
jgi:asparagine synthase (glutamine-hydrolysing)